jgi:hypothetical protein
MTTLREAAQQALEALESDPVPLNAINNACAVLRAALAEPEPQRKPLTLPQINQMMADAGWQNSAIRQADLDKVEKLVRTVEQAHGIGSKT